MPPRNPSLAINIIVFCPLVFSYASNAEHFEILTSSCKCVLPTQQRYESIRFISVLICSRLRLKKSNNNSCNRFWWLRPQNNRLNIDKVGEES